MEMENYRVLGVMSGTSLDGIDIALIQFTKRTRWEFEIGPAETIPYPGSWVQRLKEAVRLDKSEVGKMDLEYTLFLAGAINDFMVRHAVEGLDAICSHGHTIWHQPAEGITVQIGNRQELARLTGQKVICDFRIGDVRLGGQGAPLVPIGDRLLFPEYRYCLNLGGFANVSMEENGTRLAYDICAVNTVLNHYAGRIGLPYDSGGELARSGTADKGLLESLAALPFYKMPAPKSLGVEWVEEEVIPLIDGFHLEVKDVLATFTLHVAQMLARAFKGKGRVLVTGGGAYNTFLMEQLQERIEAEVVIPDAKTLEYKEALIFGLLGVLRMRGEVNCLSSVTGAAHDHSSGVLFMP